MKAEPLPPERIGELTELYNRHAGGIPFTEEVSQGRLADAWGWRDSGRSAQLDGEQLVLSVTDGGAHVGFVHLASGRFPGPELHGDEYPGVTGVIRMLTYPPGRRQVGQVLLEAAEACLRERMAARVLAFPNNGYVFQRFGFGELSDHCGHIVALLGVNGYSVVRGEVFLGLEDLVIPGDRVLDVAADLSVERIAQEGETRDSIEVVARLDGELVGTCEGHSLASWGSSARSHDTVVLGPMDVEDAFQGQGWGRFLASTMLCHAQDLGYRHSATSTQQWNHRAQLFYTSLGYGVTDVAHSYLREL